MVEQRIQSFGAKVACLIGLIITGGSSALAGQELAITAADVDIKACRAFAGGEVQPVDEEKLLNVLGLLPVQNQPNWSAGQPRDWKEATFEYLIVFKRPVTFGSLFVFGTPQDVRLLKSGAALPADPADKKAWRKLDVPVAQSGGRMITASESETTQAILLTDTRSNEASAVESLRLLKQRVQNVTPGALAYASHEYYRQPQDFVPPFLYAASLVSSGTGVWQSAGKNKGVIASPPVSDINPEWFMLVWDQRQTIAGLWIHGSISELSLEHYDGPEAVNPRAGTPAEWRKVKNTREESNHGRWIQFDKPLGTRGLRLNITKVAGRGPQVAEIDGLHAFTDLGSKPVRDVRRSGPVSDMPPFEIPYKLPADANLTLVVNDPAGKRIRNVMARSPMKAGSGVAGWDLRDETGTFVPPGQYRWSALHCPTLQPRYEFTVYPNVSEHAPENSPWFTGASGSGGWLADHCNNSAVCAVGERVFLGAFMAESGVALIECDQAGRKRWGHPGFAAWTGVGHLASDGKSLFNATNVGQTLEKIWAVDVESKEVREVFSGEPTSSRKRGLQGLAARTGEVLISVGSKEDWLAGAATADDVDLAHCFPLYGPPRHPKANEVVPDPRNDFLRLCRLTSTPPGTAAQGSLVYLQSMTDAAKRQHIVLAFQRAVPIGSLALPRPEGKQTQLRVSILKPDASFPPDMSDKRQWIELPRQRADWDVIAAPEGATTRALRLTFSQGETAPSDDLLAAPDADAPLAAGGDDLEIGKSPRPKEGLTEFGGGTDRWQAKLEGLKILRRRFHNLSADAAVRVSSGQVAADGSWDAERKAPLTPANPGVYVQEWKAPQNVRGLAIKEIDGRLTKIDVFTGPDEGPIDISANTGWQEVAQYEQARRNHYHPSAVQNHDARYLDGYVDFGKEFKTRAVRLRVVEQWADRGLAGVRIDRGGQQLEPNRCRVYGVAALEYLGGESPLDSKSQQRIEVRDSSDGKLVREIEIDAPGRIAFHNAVLYAVSGNSVVKVDERGSKHQPIVTDLKQPGDLAFDSQGRLFVVDKAADRQNIRVYSPAGKYLRSVGKAGGGRRAGPWDPECLTTVIDIDVDSGDQLWVVEDQYWPKRVTLWGADGKFKKEFLGNTPYGGAGVLDPYDKSRLFCGPMEFELDWKTGRSRLKNLTWVGESPAGEVPVHIKDREYLVTRSSYTNGCGIVYLYEKDHLKLAAAVGQAQGFAPLKSPELLASLGGPSLDKSKFMWADRNGNGAVEAEEVTLTPKPDNMAHAGTFNRDLGVQCGAIRYQVKEILPSGAPLYEEQQFPFITTSLVHRLTGGDFHIFGSDNSPEMGRGSAGAINWTYPSVGSGGHALYKAANWARDQVISELSVIGHETATNDLGELIAIHTNTGAWNLWTSDGLLVGPLFRDYRDPQAKPWSMAEHKRGMTLTDITLGQEHFQGYFCRSLVDNKFYAVAGHNHVSVVEVLGLEKAGRMSGAVTVTPADLKRAQAWQEQHELAAVYQRAPVLDCYRLEKPPQIDGQLDDWQGVSANIGESARFHIGFDDANLYVAYAVEGLGPLKNTGGQWDRLFKTGASVDLQIGVDATAAVDRAAPAAGDARVLLTYMGGSPTAVLYRPVVKDAKGEPWRVVSPVAEASFDEVRRLPEVRIARSGDDRSGGYTLEAAIPLSALGLKPADGVRLKLDWGVLRTGPDGHEVLQRIYWANQATSIVADAPSEARLHPDLWGFARFHDRKRPSTEDRFEDVAGKPKDPALSGDVDDILDSEK